MPRRRRAFASPLQVRVPKPILRIPMLAIHLQRDLSTAGFNPNKQTQCTPLLATGTAAIKQQLEGGGGGGGGVATEGAAAAAGAAPPAEGSQLAARHHPLLLRLLAAELGCAPGDIVDFDLNVIDTQPGVIGGARGGCEVRECVGLVRMH